MLLPRYSLRTSLLALTGSAVFFLVVTQALLGEIWAIVIVVAVASFGGTVFFHGLFFVLASILSRIVGTQGISARTSRGGLQADSDQETQTPTRPDA